jgi:L-fucose mutarotase/ribose pyranase (RbsD/FucU family)
MSQTASSKWLDELQTALPLFGHRNWIVIADAAYPKQAASGIQTIVSDGDVADVTRAVLERVAGDRHVRPRVILDSELFFLDETDAPGIDDLRGRLLARLDGYSVERVLHERVIDRLDEAGKRFSVLIIKTTTTIPYTSIFIELDCGYWSAEAEQRLRANMSAGDSKSKR